MSDDTFPPDPESNTRLAVRERGVVTLVGAGPGDPDLLTVRAARALAEADLVLYDALVDLRMLDLAPRAAKFSVGKRAGAASVQQETIHTLMIRAAEAGKRVVRLKAGDPFVFGRGGEEVLALGAAGVEVRVVPGLSSAFAGPLAAGIPVTHRAVSQAVVVTSAVPEAPFVALASAVPAKGTTLVVLMGIGARHLVHDTLRAAGSPAARPAALVLGAHGPREWTWSGTLGELAEVTIPEAVADLPGIVVVGDVVGVGAQIRAILESQSQSRSVDEQVTATPSKENARVSG